MKRRVISTSGFDRSGESAKVTPSLPPYGYPRKRARRWSRFLRISLLFFISLFGVLLGVWIYGLQEVQSTTGWVQHIFYKEEAKLEVTRLVEDNNNVSSVAPSDVPASDMVTTSTVPAGNVDDVKNAGNVKGHWENGFNKENTWAITEVPDSKGKSIRTVVMVPLISGHYLVNVAEEGALSALDREGKVLWTKYPESYGVSGGKRVERRWVNVIKAGEGRAVAFTKGVESAFWWSNPEQPDDERPLPPGFVTVPLAITQNNEYIRQGKSGLGYEIVDSAGMVIKQVVFNNLRFQPVSIFPLSNSRVLAVNKNGLLYVIDSDGNIEKEIGPLNSGGKFKITALTVDPQGYIFVGTEKQVEIWHGSGRHILDFSIDDGCASLAITPEGKLLVGSLRGKIEIFSPVRPGI